MIYCIIIYQMILCYSIPLSEDWLAASQGAVRFENYGLGFRVPEVERTLGQSPL